ncbi:MAG: TIGR01548 family HAD-type hydrolase [Scytolyngbya sp. HA4215-MV1]|jgi:HAD superfamily phosphatase|nr:TIGR01548 family HAD-type hydrolase [Scytolyngbya sp. HA4215-MV1]
MGTIALIIFDIDGVIRDVSGSYRRAVADTVEHYTDGGYRPTATEIDALKSEGKWNNDWQASQELVYRYFEQQGWHRTQTTQEDHPIRFTYEELVAYFQSLYRGRERDPQQWSGYICQEPLLIGTTYLEHLSQAGYGWGFFSGATRGSARYVLETRLGLQAPALVAMEDAPGKPDPTGLLAMVEQLASGQDDRLPVFYLGDTVADLYTVENARKVQPDRPWIGIGILPPHVQTTPERSQAYSNTLKQAGAVAIYENVEQLTPSEIARLLARS